MNKTPVAAKTATARRKTAHTAKRAVAKRAKLHTQLARDPNLTERIAEATALYERELASGGLRRAAAPRRNATARKR